MVEIGKGNPWEHLGRDVWTGSAKQLSGIVRWELFPGPHVRIEPRGATLAERRIDRVDGVALRRNTINAINSTFGHGGQKPHATFFGWKMQFYPTNKPQTFTNMCKIDQTRDCHEMSWNASRSDRYQKTFTNLANNTFTAKTPVGAQKAAKGSGRGRVKKPWAQKCNVTKTSE